MEPNNISNNIEDLKKQWYQTLSILEECTDDYIFVFDLLNDHYTISKSALEIYNMPSDAFYNASEELLRIVHPDDQLMLSDDLAQIREGIKDLHNLEYRWIDKNDKETWISCRGKVVDNEHKLFVGRISRLDIKRKADHLTGFLTEPQLKLNYEKRMAKEFDFSGYFIIIGIDNLKKINERFGLEGGDKAITFVSRSIKKCIQEKSKIYRMYGDEFVICISDKNVSPKEIYQQIRDNLDNLIMENNYELFFTISAGIVNATADMLYEDVKIKLDFSLHTAKKKGKNCVFIYNEESYNEHLRLLDIQELMRNAINNNYEGYEVFYQPIVDVESGKLLGAEALLRWHCEKYGNLSPAQFIPILEESGLIIPVGRWVAYTAIKQCKEWQKYIPDFRININLSYIQIKKSNVALDVLNLIDKIDIDPQHLTFEFTESTYIENDAMVKKLIKIFNAEGIKFALDDFGTGYSNLAYLQNLNVDVIKIDRSFVNKAMTDDNIYSVISHIIDMAHNMKLSVCIEGIENEDEQNRISSLVPDTMQGYLYGKPVNAEQFMKDNIKRESA